MEPVSRENEPSAFAWIFGGVLAALAATAAVIGLRRRRPDEIVAEGDETDQTH